MRNVQFNGEDRKRHMSGMQAMCHLMGNDEKITLPTGVPINVSWNVARLWSIRACS
jgi:hypothetical protein